VEKLQGAHLNNQFSFLQTYYFCFERDKNFIAALFYFLKRVWGNFALHAKMVVLFLLLQ
jgi:hypothetical protein